jgi:hypothetical protein
MTARPAIGSSSTFPDLVVGAGSTARIIFLNDEIVMMRRRQLPVPFSHVVGHFVTYSWKDVTHSHDTQA